MYLILFHAGGAELWGDFMPCEKG